jgi:hypothetical protein
MSIRRRQPDRARKARLAMAGLRRFRTDTGVAFAQTADISRRRGERVKSNPCATIRVEQHNARLHKRSFLSDTRLCTRLSSRTVSPSLRPTRRELPAMSEARMAARRRLRPSGSSDIAAISPAARPCAGRRDRRCSAAPSLAGKPASQSNDGFPSANRQQWPAPRRDARGAHRAQPPRPA